MRLGTLYTQAQDLTKNYREKPCSVITPHAWYQELQVIGFNVYHRYQQVVLVMDEVPDKVAGLSAESIMSMAHKNVRYFGYVVMVQQPLESQQPMVALSTYDLPAKRRDKWTFRTDAETTGHVSIVEGKFNLELEIRVNWAKLEHLYQWAAHTDIPAVDNVYKDIEEMHGVMQATVGWLPEGGGK